MAVICLQAVLWFAACSAAPLLSPSPLTVLGSGPKGTLVPLPSLVVQVQQHLRCGGSVPCGPLQSIALLLKCYAIKNL